MNINRRVKLDFIHSTMSTPLNKIVSELGRVKRLTRLKQRKFISTCGKDFLHCFTVCARGLIKGRHKVRPTQLKKLRRYKKLVRNLMKKKVSLKAKRRILQTGGFLNLILPPVLSFLTSFLNK